MLHPPNSTVNPPTAQPAPAQAQRPTGPFSPARVRLIIICAIAAALFFMVATSAKPTKKPTDQQQEALDTANAARNMATSNARRDYRDAVARTVASAARIPAALPATEPYQAAISNQDSAAMLAGGPRVPPYQQRSSVPTVSPSYDNDSVRASNPVIDQRSTMLAEDDKREHDSLQSALIVSSSRGSEATTHTSGSSTAAAARDSSQVPSQKAAPERSPDQSSRNSAVGATYTLFEGTILETVLTNRLNSSDVGPVDCMVTIDVWSHSRQHLLIPQGARILGEARRVSRIGQDRIAVIFHRLIMPDGFSVSLDKVPALDQIGATGLRDKVNNHYVQIFGASVALGAIAGLASRGSSYGINQTSGDAFRQGFSQELSQEGTQILDRFLNILPTVTIREGTRVKVYLTADISLPAYQNHRMAPDL